MIVAAQLVIVSSLLDIIVGSELENPEVLKTNAAQLLHLLAEGDADIPGKIFQETGVKALVSVLRTLTLDSKIVPPVMKLLEYLARTSAEVRGALECIPDAPRAIVQVAFSDHSNYTEGDVTMECACSLLCLIAMDNVEAQNNLAQSGALKQLLTVFTNDHLPIGPEAVWNLIRVLADNSECRDIVMSFVEKSSDISYTGSNPWG